MCWSDWRPTVPKPLSYLTSWSVYFLEWWCKIQIKSELSELKLCSIQYILNNAQKNLDSFWTLSLCFFDPLDKNGDRYENGANIGADE